MPLTYPMQSFGRFKLGLGFNYGCLHDRFGVDLGERYHKDPEFRIRTTMDIDRAVHAAYGRIGLGYEDPFPRASIEPFGHRFVPAMYGCKCVFQKDGEPWAESGVWTAEQTDALRPWTVDRFETSGPVREVLEQARAMRRIYEAAGRRAAEFNPHFRPLSSLQNLGSVVNTGVSVMGSDLFLNYIDDPGLVRRFYENVTELMLLCLRYFPAFDGQPLTDVFVGDCSVAMISPAQYVEFNFPFDLQLVNHARAIGAKFLVHQDSAVTPHLENYARLGYVHGLDFGQDTDFEKAAALFPRASANCMWFPSWLQSHGSPEIREEARRLLRIGTRFASFSFTLYEIDTAIAGETLLDFHRIVKEEALALYA